MGRGVALRTDVETADGLRLRAQNEEHRRTAQRMFAIANVMDGMSRADAALAAGIERQSLCDAIKRYNVEGLAGLLDRPKGHRPERLTKAEQSALIDHIVRGSAAGNGHAHRRTLTELCCFIEAQFNKTMAPQSMSRVLRRLDLSK